MAGHTASPEAHSRAVAKYNKKTYDRIEIRYTKESNMKKIITEHAIAHNEDVSQFIKRAIKQAIDNDNKE